LILPEKNLITNKLNYPIYFGRMADELIRYSRIKTFMFQPQSYLSFGNVGYNLRDNEIIMIQSLLTQEYFETLIPAVINKYVKNNSYDEAEPIITQIYENTIPSLDHAIGRKSEHVCDKVRNNNITSGVWKKCFPENYKEIEYSKFNYCTFHFIIDIIEKKTGNKYTINEIKNQLYEEYKKYLKEYNGKIVDILIIEGKKTLGDQVKAETLNFSSFIYTDNYFITTFDIWLLVEKYKIPTIFICQKFILQTNYKKHAFIGYGDKTDKFIFILLPAFRYEIIPGYKLIETDKEDIFIEINNLREEGVNILRDAFENKVTIKDYLEKFTKPTTTKYVKKGNLFIEEEEKVEPSVEVVKKVAKKVAKKEAITTEQIVEEPKKRTKKKIVLKGKQTKKSRNDLFIIRDESN
jgi:hypothetical protein